LDGLAAPGPEESPNAEGIRLFTTAHSRPAAHHGHLLLLQPLLGQVTQLLLGFTQIQVLKQLIPGAF
jgi:hypothetical protein